MRTGALPHSIVTDSSVCLLPAINAQGYHAWPSAANDTVDPILIHKDCIGIGRIYYSAQRTVYSSLANTYSHLNACNQMRSRQRRAC